MNDEMREFEDFEAELQSLRPRRLSPGMSGQMLERIPGQVADSEKSVLLRWPVIAAAIAACAVIGVGIWAMSSDPVDSPTIVQTPAIDNPPIHLAGWRIDPVEQVAYRMDKSQADLVRLDRGELHVKSIPLAAGESRADLQIRTSEGTARAMGTEFYIGTHAPGQPDSKGKPMKKLTRIFVITGMVSLMTPLGNVTGSAGELLAAEAGKAPVKLAVQANSDFAFDMFKQLSAENAGENLFFSPYSVSSALAMTAEGARGKTAMEMGKVLRFPDATRRVGDDAQLIPWRTSLIHTGMAGINDRLMAEDTPAQKAARKKIPALRKAFEALNAKSKALRKQRKWAEYNKNVEAERAVAAELNKVSAQVDQYELRVANALWGEKTYPFLDAYVKTISKHYKTGGIFPADFKNNFPAERIKVNNWVAGQTKDRIKDIVPELPPAQASLVRLILTNAIYFKGAWSVPFKEADTKPRDFMLADGKKIKAPIMNARKLEVGRYAAFNADGSAFKTPTMIERGKKTGLYPDAKGFAMLELPYKGDDISMVLIAPNSPDGLGAVEKKLTTGNLTAWIGKLKKRKTNVFLPKFKLETKYEMNDTLKAMGMPRAFTDPRLANGADFTGMCASKDRRLRLYISKVIHKAFVEVNEKGTEAAAATVVMMVQGVSARMTVPFTPTFQADRPFLFVIRDKQTHSVLFMGRINNPQAK
jgi:serpin B